MRQARLQTVANARHFTPFEISEIITSYIQQVLSDVKAGL